jgi:hypothetical protein
MRKRLILAALCGLFATTPLFLSVRAASPSPAALLVTGSPTQANQSKPAKNDPSIRTFTGTISKNGDQFVLTDPKSHKVYQLDDQDAASRFAEKNVTVTGTLDTVKNIIRIQSIAEAAA